MSTPTEQVLGKGFRFYVAPDATNKDDPDLLRVKNENELSYNYELATEESNSKENDGQEISGAGVERHSLRVNVAVNHGIADAGTQRLLASNKQLIHGAITYAASTDANWKAYVEGAWLVTGIEMTGSANGVVTFAISLKGAGVTVNMPFRAYSAT